MVTEALLLSTYVNAVLVERQRKPNSTTLVQTISNGAALDVASVRAKATEKGREAAMYEETRRQT